MYLLFFDVSVDSVGRVKFGLPMGLSPPSLHQVSEFPGLSDFSYHWIIPIGCPAQDLGYAALLLRMKDSEPLSLSSLRAFQILLRISRSRLSISGTRSHIV